MKPTELQAESERCRKDADLIRNAGDWKAVAAVLADHFERRADELHAEHLALENYSESL